MTVKICALALQISYLRTSYFGHLIPEDLALSLIVNSHISMFKEQERR